MGGYYLESCNSPESTSQKKNDAECDAREASACILPCNAVHQINERVSSVELDGRRTVGLRSAKWIAGVGERRRMQRHAEDGGHDTLDGAYQDNSVRSLLLNQPQTLVTAVFTHSLVISSSK